MAAIGATREKSSYETYLYLSFFHRFLGHIGATFPRRDPPDNRDIRISFLTGFKTEEDMAKEVQKRDKKFQKDMDHHNVAETLEQGGETIFQKILHKFRTGNTARLLDDDLREFISEVQKLIQFVNSCFISVASKYQSSTAFQISDSPMKRHNFDGRTEYTVMGIDGNFFRAYTGHLYTEFQLTKIKYSSTSASLQTASG